MTEVTRCLILSEREVIEARDLEPLLASKLPEVEAEAVPSIDYSRSLSKDIIDLAQLAAERQA